VSPAALLPSLVLLSLAADPAPPRGGNGVPGLELPADQEADPSEGFVTITAKTEAKSVRWLVVCPEKVKYLEVGPSLVVSVPAVPTEVQVFCVALLKDDLTPFARTVITVRGPKPGPAPGPKPVPARDTRAGKLHVTVVLDFSRLTEDEAALAKSETLRPSLAGGGAVLHGPFPADSPVLKASKLEGHMAAAGGAPCVVVQDDRGAVLAREKLPAGEAGLLALVARLRKGG
jgi:hypothetical protein